MVWLIVAVLGLLLALRQSMLALLSATLLLLYMVYEGGHPEYLVYDLWEALNRETLLVFPVFVVASTLMNYGASTRRLVELCRVLARPWPSSLAAVSLLAIVFASALCGSPSIALLGFGPALYRSLVDGGYAQSFSMGLLCAGSVVGVLLPLSTPLVIYGAISQVDLTGLFVSGLMLAIAMVLLLAIYSALANWNLKSSSNVTHEYKRACLLSACRQALPALAAVAVLVSALLIDRFTHAQCSVLFLCALLIAELGFYRELNLARLTEVGQVVCQQLGRVLPLVALGISLSVFLLYQQAPERFVEWLKLSNIESVHFLALANLGLLILGLIMDATSALYVVTPLLSGVAEQLAIVPESFGVMLVFNVAVGYLTPPNGLVLIAAMFAFRENFATVLSAVTPFLAVLWLGVVSSAFVALF